LKIYWKLLVLVLVILGFLTFLPWPVSSPDFLGNYSLCSFTPISNLGMFILAFALYSFATDRKKALYAFLAILLALLGFTGFWYVAAKMPMNDIQINVSVDYFRSGYDRGLNENLSVIWLNFDLRNPSDRDSLGFVIENPRAIVDNWQAPAGAVDDTLGTIGYTWLASGRPIVIKGHQNQTLKLEVRFYHNSVPTDVLIHVLARNFTLTMAGLLVVRPYFDATYAYASINGSGKLVLVARPFSISSLLTWLNYTTISP